MDFKGPSIVKLNGGLGQQNPSDRNVAGLIIANGYAVGSTFPLGSTKELNSIDDAIALGLSAATDANAAADTTASTYYHIDEFFRLNPDGKLYVHNGSAVATADIFAVDGPADALLAASANDIRFMGLVFGMDPDATLVTTSGFAADVLAAKSAGQTWLAARAGEFIYIDTLVIEGYAASSTLIDLLALDAPQVVITVACDFGYFADANAIFKKTAAVGMELGSIGVRMLSESKGSVRLEKYPNSARGQANYSLVDVNKNRWVTPGLSTTQTYDSLSQTVKTNLATKGYSFVGRYQGYPGIYLNGDATCTLATDDFNTVHANRVWDECARRIRRALIPRMNSRVKINPTTGQIDPSTIADWDTAAKAELHDLLAEGEIADFSFTIDPNQNVAAQGKVITKLRITLQGIAKDIEADLGFTNLLQAA